MGGTRSHVPGERVSNRDLAEMLPFHNTWSYTLCPPVFGATIFEILYPIVDIEDNFNASLTCKVSKIQDKMSK